MNILSNKTEKSVANRMLGFGGAFVFEIAVLYNQLQVEYSRCAFKSFNLNFFSVSPCLRGLNGF